MAISLPRSAEAADPSALTASSMTVRSMSGMDLGTPGCAIERSSKSPEMVKMPHQYTSTYSESNPLNGLSDNGSIRLLA